MQYKKYRNGANRLVQMHVIDYTQENFTSNGETHDIILDTVGKTTFAQCKSSLTPDGKYVQINGGLLGLAIASNVE